MFTERATHQRNQLHVKIIQIGTFSVIQFCGRGKVSFLKLFPEHPQHAIPLPSLLSIIHDDVRLFNGHLKFLAIYKSLFVSLDISNPIKERYSRRLCVACVVLVWVNIRRVWCTRKFGVWRSFPGSIPLNLQSRCHEITKLSGTNFRRILLHIFLTSILLCTFQKMVNIRE
jgi:hypothetical protein